MLRKKQKPTPQTRNVRPQQSANVFSYYASRSTGDGSQTRRTEQVSGQQKRKLTIIKRQWLAYTPSFLAGLVLCGCLVYITTLQTSPNLQLVGDQRETGLVAAIESYEYEVGALFAESLTNRSKLLINTDAIANQIQQKFPELGEVAVVLPLVGRRPVVQVQPAKPALVLGTVDGAFVVDENGRIVAEAKTVDSSVRDKLPTLQDESGLSLERGSYALPKEAVSFVQEVSGQMKHNGYKIHSLTLPPIIANEIHMRIEGKPYYVKFDLRGEGRVQAGTFAATYEKLEQDKVTPREYIDVRVPGKAYYK